MNKNIDAQITYDNDATKDDLMNMSPVTRTQKILEIEAIEKLTPENEGVELNEGYNYNVQGAIPQIADAIAKMANELDNFPDMGINAGGAFISLIVEYYKKVKGGE